MAVREERVDAPIDRRPVDATASIPRRRWGVSCAVALALTVGALYAVHCDRPAFFDNEGRFAEVAREMVESGDWITPRLDGTLFLNKPPLTYWLAGLVFRAVGPSEWARLVPVLAAVLTLLATCRIGALLYGEAAGLLAGLVLATSVGFALEARTLRPDLLMTAAIVTALFCWLRAERGDRRWSFGLWAALGIGVLAKGLVPLVVVGIPVGVATLRAHGWRGIGRVRPVAGLCLLAAIVLPWHVLVARAHPGFAWDYVVNQHFLFFLDKKLPRDSEGDALWFYWTSFATRLLPWSILLPLSLPDAVRGASPGATAAERATFFLWTWAAGVLVFFSLAPSRLEHYSLPALPAAALLVSRVSQRAAAGRLGPLAWWWLAAMGAVLVAVGAVGLADGRALLTRAYWIAEAPAMFRLLVPATLTLATMGLLVVVAALRRRMALLGGALAGGMVVLVPIVVTALIGMTPVFSWRPVADALAAAVPHDVPVVFEAPEEYQQVGGLAFYTRRTIALLEPPGFIPPTYLEGDDIFLARDEFRRRWTSRERLAFVSDPQQRRDESERLVPGPYHVVARFGDRWVLVNYAAR